MDPGSGPSVLLRDQPGSTEAPQVYVDNLQEFRVFLKPIDQTVIVENGRGWNLYVCGNGGITPRHGDLFATDLDRETLIKYIDRFLMYYIKTADKLQRTSTWMTKLEGGLDHLQDVVINDSLGICEELEAQMAHLVDTYECEWKNAIEDPEKLKRFSHFQNTDEVDDTVEFVDLRGQITPARLNEANEEETDELAKA